MFPTGVSGTGAIGTATAEGIALAVVSGVTGLSLLGGPQVDDMAIGVTGLSASGNIGIVFIWGEIIPDQAANWSEISPADADIWSDITPNQVSDWKEVA